MTKNQLFLGIDLGTTNSVQAVHDGDTCKLVRSSDGSVLTPSVVRIDGRGRVSVGARARSFLVSDPDNTRSEFKRLMGSPHGLDFGAAHVSRSPSELSAEVLKSLRHDFAEQFGEQPMRAVISVPALFELPQLEATSDAARLAGFERVEFIQEPIASAIASGWSAQDGQNGSWLVYDLGGGTFDVSLLESREGLLRVVGHDGNNFLGGRDIDQGLAEWALGRLARDGAVLDVTRPELFSALRRLRAACELAKIELTRSHEADIVVPELCELGGAKISVDLVVTRAELEVIVRPIVERSLEICLRLLGAHGLAPEQLQHVVLVGGPTLIPSVRELLAAVLPVSGANGVTLKSVDPMALVAEGAALFAFSQGLSSAPAAKTSVSAAGPSVWLQYSAVSSDPNPYVVGKVGNAAKPMTTVCIERTDHGFSTQDTPLDDEQAFAVPVELIPRGRATFRIWGKAEDGVKVALVPHEFTISHGVSLGEPPLSRSIGVALANDEVQVFFEKGSPLPVRRTFRLRTVETVSPGNTGFALLVPIVQGEFPFAHLCRLVGALEISAAQIATAVPAGAAVEVTLELDRGGRLSASAKIDGLDQVFEQVAHLVMPDSSIDSMRLARNALSERGALLRGEAFRNGDQRALRTLLEAERLNGDAQRAIELAAGGDPDASERARRLLIDLDGLLSEAEALRSWPKLEEEARYRLAVESGWLAKYGTTVEQSLFDKTAEALERALKAKSSSEVRRQLHAAARLGDAAYYRSPRAWPDAFERLLTRVHELSNPVQGKKLVEEGRQALARGELRELERIVTGLWQLLPPDPERRRLGHDSGVR
ncbi:MAG TPA: Hsp70 family protein [Polyangiaceae bacterium]|nr:Hsp70 family protein [Polyangiaceae bacterium]